MATRTPLPALSLVRGKSNAPSSLHIRCHVKPGADKVREGILAVSDAAVELCVAAAPRNGESNKAVVQVLSHVSTHPLHLHLVWLSSYAHWNPGSPTFTGTPDSEDASPHRPGLEVEGQDHRALLSAAADDRRGQTTRRYLGHPEASQGRIRSLSRRPPIGATLLCRKRLLICSISILAVILTRFLLLVRHGHEWRPLPWTLPDSMKFVHKRHVNIMYNNIYLARSRLQ